MKRHGSLLFSPVHPAMAGLMIGQAISWSALAVLYGLLLSACASSLYPITSGAHRSLETGRYLVWSNHPGVTAYITGVLLENRRPVVERARLEAIFTEQHLILSHAKDGDVLRVGKLTGATQVIFAEVHQASGSLWSGPGPQSVTIRAVSIESAEVLWSGRAAFNEASSNPDQAAIYLAHWAMNRATCPGTWEEHTASAKGGCQEGAKTVKTTERSIWKELWGYEHGR